MKYKKLIEWTVSLQALWQAVYSVAANVRTNIMFIRAGFGWYRYEARFALPIFDESGEVERYNVFHAALLMRHALDGKLYLYDIMAIKKETSNLFQSKDLTQ